MNLTLQYFDGCPNWRVAATRLEEALERRGLGGTHIELQRIESVADAERCGFHGSPTVLRDGHDIFDSLAGAVGLSCRVYAGPDGAPSVDEFADALGP